MQSSKISTILEGLLQKSGFLTGVLTDHEGLPICSVSANGYDPETQAAVVGIVHRVINQAHEQLGISPATEFTLTDSNGNFFVCRLFSVKGEELALAFLIPDKNHPYRRLMKQAIVSISKSIDL